VNICDLTAEELLLRALGADDESDEPGLCILHDVEEEAGHWADILLDYGSIQPRTALAPSAIAHAFMSMGRRVEVASEMLRRKLKPEASP
jgi:hypothetical protein